MCEPVLERGLLDTSTVILLGRIDDPTALPDEPVISAVTLAELSVGPLVTDDLSRNALPDLRTCNRPSRTSPPLPFDACVRPCHSVASQRTYGGPAGSPRHACMTR